MGSAPASHPNECLTLDEPSPPRARVRASPLAHGPLQGVNRRRGGFIESTAKKLAAVPIQRVECVAASPVTSTLALKLPRRHSVNLQSEELPPLKAPEEAVHSLWVGVELLTLAPLTVCHRTRGETLAARPCEFRCFWVTPCPHPSQ